MNAKQIKTAFLSDIDALIDLTKEQAEKQNGYTLESYIEVYGNIPVKKRNQLTETFLMQADGADQNWDFQYGDFKCSFTPEWAMMIRKGVSHFPQGSSPTSTGTVTHRDLRAKEMQKGISLLRELYHGRSYVTEQQNTDAKNSVIRQYKKAGENDLIRLCWKYITNPVDLEGVHIAWENEPVVKFEAYEAAY